MKISLNASLSRADQIRVKNLLATLVLLAGCSMQPIDTAARASTQPATSAAIAAIVPPPYGQIAAFLLAAAGGWTLRHVTGNKAK